MCLPFRTSETEAVGQFALQCLPELNLLLFRQPKYRVVVRLEFLVRLDDLFVVAIVSIISSPSPTSAFASATTASASLCYSQLRMLMVR